MSSRCSPKTYPTTVPPRRAPSQGNSKLFPRINQAPGKVFYRIRGTLSPPIAMPRSAVWEACFYSERRQMAQIMGDKMRHLGGDKVRHLGLTAAALCAVAGLTATTAE